MNTAYDLDSVTNEEHFQAQTALIICCPEELNIKLANNLAQHFEMSSRTYSDIESALQFLMDNSCEYVILNLDAIDLEYLPRLKEVLKLRQTPTLVISHNIHADEEFNLNQDFCQFAITTSLSKHFLDVTKTLFKQTNTLIKFKKRIQRAATGEKPKSFYFLAALLFLEPVFKVLYMKFQTEFSFETVLSTIFSMPSLVSHFEFWALFPLAGVALISQRSWSFAVFIAVQAYSLFAHFFYVEFTWPYVSDSPHLSSTFLLVFNTAIVLYFLVPEYRRPFWNMSQKLWRDTSRYATKLPTYFTLGDEKLYTSIQNISQSGAYFQSSENIPVGETTILQFIINGKVHEAEAVVKRTHNTQDKNKYGYGVEFSKVSDPTKEILNQYIEKLETKLQ